MNINLKSRDSKSKKITKNEVDLSNVTFILKVKCHTSVYSSVVPH